MNKVFIGGIGAVPKLEEGAIYDHPISKLYGSTLYSIKIVKLGKTKNGKKFAEMKYTNNPKFGKGIFVEFGKGINEVLKGYTKRK